MKWITLYSLTVIFFLGLLGQEASNLEYTDSTNLNIELRQTPSQSNIYLEHLSILDIFGEVEIEVEDDDDDKQYESSFGLKLKSSLPLVLKSRIGYSIFKDTKPTKLYILFHSWKSHLSS